MSNTPLVEPAAQPAEEAQIPTGVAASVDGAAPLESSLAALRDGLSKMPPAKPEPSAAQLASQPPAEEKPAEKPAESGGVRETTGGALESFQGDLKQARKQKAKAQADAAAAEDARQGDDAPPADIPPASDAPPAKTDDEPPVTDEEIDKTINDPGISKRHQKRMIHLANRAKDAERKLAEAEAKPKTDANDVKVKELEEKAAAADRELLKYRHRYALESEPELKKFEEQATQAETAIYSKLKEAGLSDATVKMVQDMGGFDGFSRSTKQFIIKGKNEDGDDVDVPITAAALAKKWLNDMNVGDSEYIRAKMKEKFDSIDGKRRKAEELSSQSEQWFKDQQAAQQKLHEEQQQLAQGYRSGYEKEITDWEKQQEALKDKAVPATATAEERKEIEQFNAHNAGVRAMLKMAVAPSSLTDHVAVVKEAASALLLRRDNTSLKKQLAEATAKLERLTKATTTTGKAGAASISRAPAKTTDKTAAGQLAVSAADSLRDAMDKLRAGGGDE